MCRNLKNPHDSFIALLFKYMLIRVSTFLFPFRHPDVLKASRIAESRKRLATMASASPLQRTPMLRFLIS
jgi:hypothetical protein